MDQEPHPGCHQLPCLAQNHLRDLRPCRFVHSATSTNVVFGFSQSASAVPKWVSPRSKFFTTILTKHLLQSTLQAQSCIEED